MLTTHISSGFDEDLNKVFSEVLAMAGLVEQQLEMALGLLSNPDETVIRQILESEQRANHYEKSIDQQCLTFLARRQPAAGDLRLVLAMFKVISDLERIGDEAEKIARLAEGVVTHQSQLLGIISMGELVRGMMHGAMTALARLDAESAVEFAAREPESDRQHDRMLEQCGQMSADGEEEINSLLDYMRIVRALERVADHIRNVCEHIVYCAAGKDMRHTDIETLRRELQP